MTRVLRILAALAVVSCSASSTAAPAKRSDAAPATPDAKADLDWRGKLGSGDSLDLTNVNGDVKVTRAKGSRARVRAFKSGRDAAAVDVLVDTSPGHVSVRVEYPRRKSVDADVEFVIELPNGVDFEADVVNGSVRSKGVTGAVSIKSVNGNVETTGSADVRAATVNGRVVVALPPTARRADLDTVNGPLEVHLPKALGASVRAATLSGRIDADFPLTREDHLVGAEASATLGDGKAVITLKTVNGPIKLRK